MLDSLNQIGGTGFAIDFDTLKKFGWGATCLQEDLEFTCKVVLNGGKIGWAHDAKIYDEKPLGFKLLGFKEEDGCKGLQMLHQDISLAL